MPHAWLEICIASVKSWAHHSGFDHLWLDDELFAVLPERLYAKTCNQLVVASDLARLMHLQSALESGCDTVLWCDADTLVFAPDRFELMDVRYAVGREVWVQKSTARPAALPRAFVKVHNAFMMFRQGNAFLDFYCDSAARLLDAHTGPFVTQFIGPKLLTALHNIVALPVMERAAVMSPGVATDLLAGGGNFLDVFCRKSALIPAAFNMGASGVAHGDVEDQQLAGVCELLLDRGQEMFSGCAL